MSRTRIVKGKITKIIGGNYKIYSREHIENIGGKVIQIGKENGVFYGKSETPKIANDEKIVSIQSELYMHDNQELKVPYLNVKGILNYKSSKPFISGLKSIFGDDIKHKSIKKLMQDLEEGTLQYPNFEVDRNMSNYHGGYYYDGTIYINENLIIESEGDYKKSWLLFRVILEETGHYIDDLLRNKYDNIGGDASDDEGVLFTADFIRFNDVLHKSFEFATVKICSKSGEEREFKPKVNFDTPSLEIKSRDLLYMLEKEDDHGIVTLKSGKKVEVEFFKIRGGGAVHEAITKEAAKIAGVPYDYRLDEGCAWPDVPCENEDSIETCYYNTWRNQYTKGTMAYDSHHGSKQYWHSMAPAGNYSNQQVIELIINQAKQWFRKAHETKGDDGLFHIGKILHMVQDSFSLSHVQRDEKNRIIQFQGYNVQDSSKHSEPDEDGSSKGAQDAKTASIYILSFYKTVKSDTLKVEIYLPAFENYLRRNVYQLALNRGEVKAGGSLDAYKKTEKPVLNNDEQRKLKKELELRYPTQKY